jgi:hypothetical protein
VNGYSLKPKKQEENMASLEEQVLRVTKEIVVKFIETGRVSPTGFSDLFNNVYGTVKQAAMGSGAVRKKTEETQG